MTTSTPREGDELGRKIAQAAHLLNPDRLGTGPLAELRRLDPAQPYTPALWRVLTSLDLSARSEADERAWAVLLCAMALHLGAHRGDARLGLALADAGWSELRFVRLMRAQDEALERLILQMARFLASKHQPVNWTDVGGLLMLQDTDTSERHRRRIARDYYRALYAKTAHQE
jgi:CRISPR system Cascade subunit CasB